MNTFISTPRSKYLHPLLFCTFFSLCTHLVTVQSQITVSVRSGGNFVTAAALPLPIFDKSLPVISPPTSRISLNLGVFTDISIAESWSLFTGLEYGEKHLFTSSMTFGTTSPNLFGFFEARFVEVPVLLKYTWRLPIQPYVIVGVYARKSLSAYSKIQTRDIVLQQEEIISNSINNIQSLEWGLQSGIGLSYQCMPRFSISIDGRFLYGLTDITKVIDWQPTFTREFRVCLGMGYQF